MRDDVAHQQTLLAVGGEFRPVMRDRLFQVELAAIDQHQHAGGGQPLGAGKDHLQRILGPGAARGCCAGPQIDHRFAMADHGERSPDIATLGEVAGELLGDRLKTIGHETVDRHGCGQIGGRLTRLR